MAQKEEKKGKWMFYGKYKLEDGTYKNYKRRGFKTKKEAIAAEMLFLQGIGKNRSNIQKLVENDEELQYDVNRPITFYELSQKFLEYMESRSKITTFKEYSCTMNVVNRSIGNKKLDEIDKFVLQDYVDVLDSKYSKRYVEKIYYDMNKVFKFAIKNEWIQINPLTSVERSKRPNEFQKEMKFWEPSEFNLFINEIEDPMYHCFFMTLFYMGCRRGEALALQWRDIDFTKKTITINKTTSSDYRTKRVKYSPPKTKNSYRTITMPQILCDEMKSWNSISSEFSGYCGESFVFGNNCPLPPENVRKAFINGITNANVKLQKDEQIPKIRIHDLRHSHASYLINNMSAGFTDFDIAKRLGDTVETLHNVYAHWFKQKDENIVKFIDGDDIKKEEIEKEDDKSDVEKLTELLKKLGINLNNIAP